VKLIALRAAVGLLALSSAMASDRCIRHRREAMAREHERHDGPAQIGADLQLSDLT
jgi:hypothetical protein